jgi:hypothetical protein
MRCFCAGLTTVGSVFTQMGSFGTDGSTRMGSTATGMGAVFNERDEWPNSGAGGLQVRKKGSVTMMIRGDY